MYLIYIKYYEKMQDLKSFYVKKLTFNILKIF